MFPPALVEPSLFMTGGNWYLPTQPSKGQHPSEGWVPRVKVWVAQASSASHPQLSPRDRGSAFQLLEYQGQEGRFDTLGKLVSAHLVGGWGTLAQRTSPPARWAGIPPGRWVRCASPARPTHPPRGQHSAAGCCPPPRWAETNYPSVINQLPARASPFLFMTEATSTWTRTVF